MSIDYGTSGFGERLERERLNAERDDYGITMLRFFRDLVESERLVILKKLMGIEIDEPINQGIEHHMFAHVIGAGKMHEIKAMIDAAIEAKKNGWLPIETAPRDGVECLLWDGENRVVGSYDKGRYVPWSGNVYGCWVLSMHIRPDEPPDPVEPTHWMPIANPPEVSK
jgi:hypothetical protein